MSLEVKCNS